MNNAFFDYCEKKDKALRTLASQIYCRYINHTNLYPLFFINAEKTQDTLHKAGVLYHNILSSLRFRQYRRAVWYIGVFEKWCKESLNSRKLHNIQANITNHFL